MMILMTTKLDGNLFFLNSFGYNSTCPYCFSKIWINTSWYGLPKWKIPTIPGEKYLFRCSKCDSIIGIEKPVNDPERIVLFVHEKSGSVKDSREVNYPLLVDEKSLINLIKHTLQSLAENDDGKVNVFYNDFKHFDSDMSRRIKKVIMENSDFPYPVLEV